MLKNTDLQFPYYTGSVDVVTAGGTASVQMPRANEMAIIVSIKSSPAGALARVSADEAGFTVALVTALGAAVDCSTTPAIVDYIIVKKTQA